MLALCPQVEVVGTSDNVETRSLNDVCFAEAIKEVCNDKTVYKRPSDLAYVMIAVNDATVGKFPDWKFVGDIKPKEALRRKNVFTRFSSAYFRIKHQKLDGFLDK